MASLGDLLGDSQRDAIIQQKEALIQQSVKVGTVFKIWFTSTTPPKEKLIIIVGMTAKGDYLGVVLINTEINWNVHKDPDMYDHQFFIRAEDCRFLDHDSYVNCINIHEVAQSYLVGEVMKNSRKALGEVPSEILTEVITRVKSSPVITPKIRKRFGLD